jgi:putative membrane protein
VNAGPRKPMLPVLVESDAPAERIDHGWDEIVKAPPEERRGVGQIALVMGGLAILIVGLMAVESLAYVVALWERAPWLGMIGAGVVALALLLLLWALWREVASLMRIRSAERWQKALDPNATDVRAARAAALGFLASVKDEAGPLSDARAAVTRTDDLAAIRDAVETVLTRLDAKAAAASRAAAAQSFGMTAVSPAASWDALLFAWRGVRLIRQIADIYGVRPRLVGTFMLMRRVMTSASLVAAADIAGNMVSHAILTNPWAQKIAGEVAGATVSAQRMHRLGRVAAASCRVLPGKDAASV